MKKTLFLSAILGAALCSSAFGETETATVDNTEHKGLNLNNAPYSTADTVIFNITSDAKKQYFASGTQTYSQNIQIGNGTESQGGMWINDGYGNTITFNGKVTGSGTFQKTGAGDGLKIVFAGDVTDYTGDMNLSANAAAAFTLRFGGDGVAAVETTTAKGVSGTGTITFKNAASNTLEYKYESATNPVYITNVITKANDNVTSKVNFAGGASYVLTKNATIDVLTISNGSTVTVGNGVTLALKTDNSWTQVGEETARTSGNGFGTVTVTKDFGNSLVNNNGTITANGSAVTLDDGVATSTGNSSTYYVNEGVNISSLSGATKLVVNSTSGGVNQLGLSNTAYGNLDITINGGRVITAKTGNATGFTSGNVEVKGGGTLAVVESGQDALGWGDNAKTKSLTLEGTAKDNMATFELSYNPDASLTLATNLNMNGHSQVKGTRAFNTYGGVITATGTNNVISTGVQLRSAASVVVNEDSTLLISGAVVSSTEDGAAYSMTKTGDGVLTISGNIDGTAAHTATITGDGANTILSGASISNAAISNVTLTNQALTLSGTNGMGDVAVTHGFTNNSTLTLRDTVNYVGALDTHTHALETGNGYGYTTQSGTIIAGGTGNTNTDAVTAWQIGGSSENVTYADGIVTKTTATDTYYVNNATDVITITKDTTLVSNLSEAVYKNYISLAAGKTLTITDGQTLTMLPDNPSYTTNKGVWMGAGSSIEVSNGGSLTNYGVTVTDATVTNNAKFEQQFGTHSNQEGNRHFITIEGNITVENGTGELQGYTINGGSVTVNSATTTTIKSALSATTALTVNSGSTATFSGNASVASVAGAGSLNLSHNLTVAGNASIGSLTLSNGANLTAETISGRHNGTVNITGLTVNGDANLNANLVMNSGTLSITAGNTLTMGCSVTIGDTVEVHISGAEADAIRHGSELTIINLGQLAATDVITLGTASIYIDEVKQNDFSLMRVDDADGTSRIVVAPEPATATLSLLALAGLCARRKRH